MGTLKERKVRESMEEPFAAEERMFHQKRAHLRRRYEGQFVAMYQGRVAGHGPNDEELAQRIFKKLGDVPFYIGKVEEKPTIYEVPSPEVVR
ncbi:MAG: DUF5678 domain-containing protein [Candidatus Binatia bacterium]